MSRTDCRNLQELIDGVDGLSSGDRIVLLTDRGAFRFRFTNSNIEFQESDEKGDLKPDLCPDCEHQIIVHEREPHGLGLPGCHAIQDGKDCPCTRTYESLVGEEPYCPCKCSEEAHKNGSCRHKCIPYKKPKLTLDEYLDLAASTVLKPSECDCRSWDAFEKEFKSHHVNCDGFGNLMRKENQIETQPSLSLIVVDFGDSCCVKVEKGAIPRVEVRVPIPGGYESVELIDSMLWTPRTKFADLRAALDGEKPVPRIERPTNGNYTLHVGNIVQPYSYELPFEMLDALSTLAGVQLPVWKGGKWEELTADYTPRMKEIIPLRGLSPDTVIHTLADPIEGVMEDLTREFNEFLVNLPVKIWRYIR